MAKFSWAILVAVILWVAVMVGAGAVKDPAAEQPTGAPVEETKPTGGYAGRRGRPFFYGPLDEQDEMPFSQSAQQIGTASARPSYWADGYGGYPGYGGSGGYGGQPGYGAGPGYGGGAGGGYGGGYGGGGQPYGGYGGGGSCYFNFGRCL